VADERDQPLQKAPAGLLELFRLKFGGVGPPLFGRAVLPVVEVGEHYGADLLFGGQGDDTAGALPRVSSETLGSTAGAYPGPIALHALSFGVVVGAAAGTWMEATAGLTIIEPTGAPSVYVGLVARAFTPRAGAQFFADAWIPPRPLIIRNGTILLATVAGDAAGADHRISVRWLYTQLSPQAIA